MKTSQFTLNYCICLLSFAPLLFSTGCGDDENSSNVNDIDITSISPESPASLKFYETSSDDRVVIEYNYNIGHKEGARIWIIPYTDGDSSPGYVYSSSPVYKGKGSKKVLVSVEGDTDPINVDQLLIYIESDETEELLVERYIDVDYIFE